MLFDIYVYIREHLANGGGNLPGPKRGIDWREALYRNQPPPPVPVSGWDRYKYLVILLNIKFLMKYNCC